MSCNIIRITNEKNYRFGRCVDNRLRRNRRYCRINKKVITEKVIIASNLTVHRMARKKTSSITKKKFHKISRYLHTASAFKDLLDKLLIEKQQWVPQIYWRWYLQVFK